MYLLETNSIISSTNCIMCILRVQVHCIHILTHLWSQFLFKVMSLAKFAFISPLDP